MKTYRGRKHLARVKFGVGETVVMIEFPDQTNLQTKYRGPLRVLLGDAYRVAGNKNGGYATTARR